MEIGCKIHTLRKRAGMSQEELSFVLNVSRQTVSKWETNAMKPETDKIIMLCRIFDISADILLRDDVPLPNSVKQAVVDSIKAYVVLDSIAKCDESIDITCDCKTENERVCLATENCVNELIEDVNCEAVQTDYDCGVQTSLNNIICHKKTRLVKAVLSMSKVILCLGIAVWLIYSFSELVRLTNMFDKSNGSYVIYINEFNMVQIIINVCMLITILLAFITVIVGEYIERKKKRL